MPLQMYAQTDQCQAKHYIPQTYMYMYLVGDKNNTHLPFYPFKTMFHLILRFIPMHVILEQQNVYMFTLSIMYIYIF